VNGEVDECLRTIGSFGAAAAPSSQFGAEVCASVQAVVSSSEVVKVRLWSG
jgi:hypothetical protein